MSSQVPEGSTLTYLPYFLSPATPYSEEKLTDFAGGQGTLARSVGP